MVAKIQVPKRTSTIGNVSLGRQTQQTGATIEGAAKEASVVFRETANNIIVQHDQTRTKSAFNDFRERARQEYGRLNSLKGNDAIGVNSVSQQYNTWYDTNVSEISDDLDNIDQQNDFRILSDRRKESDLDSLSAHESTQANAYSLSVHQGEISNAQADTMFFFNNDSKMEDVENGLKLSFETTFSGLDTTDAEQKEIAAIRSLRIKMLAENGSVDKARELLESSKDELKGAYLPLKNLVDKQDVVEKSQTESDRIMATVQGEGEQQKEARAITDSDVRDATLSRVKTYQQDNKRIADNKQQQQNDDITNAAVDIFRKGGTKTEFLRLVEKTRDPAIRKELIRLSEFYYPETTKPVKTDFNQFIDAQKRIDLGLQQGSPISDAELIRTYQPFLSTSKMDEVLDYSKNGGNIGGLTKPVADRWFFFYTERKSEDRSEAFGTYWNYLRDRLEPGKKPTTDNIKQWSDEWFQSEGTKVGGGIPFFDLTDLGISQFESTETRARAIRRGKFAGFGEIGEVEEPGELLPDGTVSKPITDNRKIKRDPDGIRDLIGK